ncbi:MAG: hypothetical protein ACRCUM_01740, partial [Mycoplasmoidaceae bacterium]
NTLGDLHPHFNSQRRVVAEEWKKGKNLSRKQSRAVINNLSFIDDKGKQHSGSSVIDNIIFDSETILQQIPFSNGEIYVLMYGPDIKINVKDRYIDDNIEKDLIIRIGETFIPPHPEALHVSFLSYKLV